MNPLIMKLTEKVGVLKIDGLEFTVFESRDVKDKRNKERISEESFVRGIGILLNEFNLEFPTNKVVNVDYKGNVMSFYITPDTAEKMDLDVVHLEFQHKHDEKKILA